MAGAWIDRLTLAFRQAEDALVAWRMPSAAVWVLCMTGLCGEPVAAEAFDASAERVAVDASRAPFDAVGVVNNSVGGRCTGILVDRDLALTAAHCLFSARTGHFVRPQSVHFLLGFNRGAYRFHTVAAKIVLSPGFDPKVPLASTGSDWAILRLVQPAPEEIAAMAIAQEMSAPRRVVAVGFARERSQVMTKTQPCFATFQPESGIVVSACAGSHGMSGGPLIDVVSGELVGMQVAATRDGNATRTIGVAAPRLRAALSGARD